MAWLYLLLAVAALAVALKTASTALMVLALLAALGLLIAGLLGVLAARVERRSSDPSTLVDAVELQRLREQAEARRAAAASTPPEP